jgi:hypothetical protein
MADVDKKTKDAEKYATRAVKAHEAALKKESKSSSSRGSSRWSFRSFSRSSSKSVATPSDNNDDWDDTVDETPPSPTIVDKVKHSIAKATGHPSAFPPAEPRKKRFGGEIFVKLSGRGEPKQEVRCWSFFFSNVLITFCCHQSSTRLWFKKTQNISLDLQKQRL